MILFSSADRASSVDALRTGLSRGSSDLSVSLGSDNVVGGLVLLLTGALLLAGQRRDSGADRRFTVIAACLAPVAADARTTTAPGARCASTPAEAT